LETTTAKVRQLVCDAVIRQLISDVPVCTLLSGGLDSSAITALAAGACAGQLQTWSVDFTDNERYLCPTCSNQYRCLLGAACFGISGDRTHTITIEIPELVDALTTAMEARDLPGMADIDASLYLFSKEINIRQLLLCQGSVQTRYLAAIPGSTTHRQQQKAHFPG